MAAAIEATKQTNYLKEVIEGVSQKGIDRKALLAITEELDKKRDPRRRVALEAKDKLWPLLGDIEGLTRGKADTMKHIGFSTRKEISDLVQDSTIFASTHEVPSAAEVTLGELRNQMISMIKGPDSLTEVFVSLLAPEASQDLQEATLQASRKLKAHIKGAEVILREAKRHHQESADANRKVAQEQAFRDDFDAAWGALESGEDEVQFAEHAPGWNPSEQRAAPQQGEDDSFPLPEGDTEDQMKAFQQELQADPQAVDNLFGDTKQKSPSRQRRAPKAPKKAA